MVPALSQCYDVLKAFHSELAIRREEGVTMPVKMVTRCGTVPPGNYRAKALRLALEEFAKNSDMEVTPIFLDKLDMRAYDKAQSVQESGRVAKLERLEAVQAKN
jgi:hypothetical protein